MFSEKGHEKISIQVIVRFLSVFIGVSIIYGFAGMNQLTSFIKNIILNDDSEIITFLSNVFLPYAIFINALPSVIILPTLGVKIHQLLKSFSIHDDETIIQLKKYGKIATLTYFISWLLFGVTEVIQYQLNTSITLNFNQTLIIVGSYGLYAILVSASAYLAWEYFGMDWIVSLRKGTALNVPIGISFRWKLVIISYVIPFLATFLITQSILTSLSRYDLNNLATNPEKINVITTSVLTAIISLWIPIIITTLPLLLREVKNVNALQKSFEQLKTQESDRFTLTMLPVQNAGNFGKIVSDYNQFITQLHARVLFSLDSAHQLESFFNDLNNQVEQLVRAQEDIAKSMEFTTTGVQHQSEALQEITTLLNDVQDTFAQLFQQATSISHDITQLTTQIRIISLNARIEAARGHDAHGATITFIAQRITQLSQQVKQLQEQLQEQFNQRLQEYSQKFDDVIRRINDVQEIARDNAASSEEVSASVEEATATLHATREEAQSLSELLANLIKELERYSTIQQVE